MTTKTVLIEVEVPEGARILHVAMDFHGDLHQVGFRLVPPARAVPDERAEFEEWATGHLLNGECDEDVGERLRLEKQAGCYLWPETQAAYDGWNARALLAAAPAEVKQ